MTEPEELNGATKLVEGGATLVQVTNETMRAVSVGTPRDLDDVLRRVIYEIERVPAWAEAGFYDRPVGDGKRVAGASVTLTRIIARNFGNCSLRSYLHSKSGEIGDETFQMSGVFTDYQTNYMIERPFPVSSRAWRKADGYVVLEGEKLMQALLIGASKAERNAAAAGVPDFIMQSAFERCRQIAADTTKKQLSALVTWFQEHGVSRESLERELDGTSLDALDDEQLARVRGLANAIRDRELRPSEIGGRDDAPEAVSDEEAAATIEDVLGSGSEITGGRAADDTLAADLQASLVTPGPPDDFDLIAGRRAELEAELAALENAVETASPAAPQAAPTEAASNVTPLRPPAPDDDASGT